MSLSGNLGLKHDEILFSSATWLLSGVDEFCWLFPKHASF